MKKVKIDVYKNVTKQQLYENGIRYQSAYYCNKRYGECDLQILLRHKREKNDLTPIGFSKRELHKNRISESCAIQYYHRHGYTSVAEILKHREIKYDTITVYGVKFSRSDAMDNNISDRQLGYYVKYKGYKTLVEIINMLNKDKY